MNVLLTFPSESELDEVVAMLGRGVSAVEGILIRLRALEKAGKDVPVATLADLGALFSFADTLDDERANLAEWGPEIAELMGYADARRLERKARA